MLGCTKYKCKEVTGFFYTLASSSFPEKKKIQPTFKTVIDRNCKEKIKSEYISN